MHIYIYVYIFNLDCIENYSTGKSRGCGGAHGTTSSGSGHQRGDPNNTSTTAHLVTPPWWGLGRGMLCGQAPMRANSYIARSIT